MLLLLLLLRLKLTSLTAASCNRQSSQSVCLSRSNLMTVLAAAATAEKRDAAVQDITTLSEHNYQHLMDSSTDPTRPVSG